MGELVEHGMRAEQPSRLLYAHCIAPLLHATALSMKMSQCFVCCLLQVRISCSCGFTMPSVIAKTWQQAWEALQTAPHLMVSGIASTKMVSRSLCCHAAALIASRGH